MSNFKQKILIALILITFFIMIWQVYLTFDDHSDVLTPPVQAPVAAVSSLTPPTAEATVPLPFMATKAPSVLADPTENKDYARYSQLMQQYQVAQLERLVAEQQAAIAEAHKQTAEANYEAQKYDNTVVVNTGDAPIASAADHDPDYQVKMIEQVDNEWHALLEKNGQYVSVQKDKTLDDGTVISDINQQGVTLKKDNVSRVLVFHHE